MRHLKKLNELYKKSYMSAADKLGSKHPHRAKALKNWAREKGTSEPIDREHPHRFIFKDYNIIKHVKDYFDGYFFITGYELINNNIFEVKFESDYKKRCKISFKTWTTNRFNFEMNVMWNESVNSVSFFLFENRRDAIEFKKYILEAILPEEDFRYSDEIKDIHINKLYTTEFQKN